MFLVLQGAVEQKETQLWALVAELKEAQVRDTPATLQHTNRRRRRSGPPRPSGRRASWRYLFYY